MTSTASHRSEASDAGGPARCAVPNTALSGAPVRVVQGSVDRFGAASVYAAKEGVMLSGAPTPSRASKAASRTAPAGFSHGNGASRAHPAGGRRKLPPIHSNPRNARVERPAHGGNPRLSPLSPQAPRPACDAAPVRTRCAQAPPAWRSPPGIRARSDGGRNEVEAGCVILLGWTRRV
jgi:hypothetical protein